MIFNWDKHIDIRKIKIIIEAQFLLTQSDIDNALKAEEIHIHGNYYKVPINQLKLSKPGLCKLTLEEVN